MKLETIAYLSVGAIALAACASPEERCERRATAGYTELVNETSRTELNLERGYRVETEETTVKVWKLARNVSGLNSYQFVDVVRKRTVRVPIDPVLEQQRLAILQGREGRAAAHSEILLSYCQLYESS